MKNKNLFYEAYQGYHVTVGSRPRPVYARRTPPSKQSGHYYEITDVIDSRVLIEKVNDKWGTYQLIHQVSKVTLYEATAQGPVLIEKDLYMSLIGPCYETDADDLKTARIKEHGRSEFVGTYTSVKDTLEIIKDSVITI